MNDLICQILAAPRVMADFSGNLSDALNFGFSYVESEDNMVAFLVASPNTVLKILREIDEAVLDPDDKALGTLWTAKILCSKKLPENRVIFANESLLTVLLIDRTET